MSIGSELEKLSILHEKGILTDSEFEVAKNKLLNTVGSEHNTGTGVNKIGNAAVSWVNLQWVSSVIALVAAILMIVYIFIPFWQDMQKSKEQFNKDFEATKQIIDNSHKNMDERRKKFDEDFEKQQKEMDAFRKKNFTN
jgi:membrane protein insertase Oxa1/YidC/SpoIIIJ